MSGIDLALALVESHHGAAPAARVARELVVYMRRDGSADQTSVFLKYRDHLHPGVHRVQDHLTLHPDRHGPLDDLARLACMSPRHLTRVFRRTTGITLKEYASQIRLEAAAGLLRGSGLGIEQVAARCGYADARQLRRLWKIRHGANPTT
ncbi:MAG TPA: helix-turn-helix domain-containing protein, partial [Candidatus Polarisedimenticolia bacterium]|nr:helix-turn-helix domain-containing protein [Candidatus Polarisedimenticolia bacterium]